MLSYGAVSPGEKSVIQKCELCTITYMELPVREGCPNNAIVLKRGEKMKYVYNRKFHCRRGSCGRNKKIDTEGEITIIGKEPYMYIQDLLYRICCMAKPMRKNEIPR